MAIDWSKAPEGATHYYTRGDTPWRDLSGENWKWWADGKWHSDNAVSASIDRSSRGFFERRCAKLIPRPAADLKNVDLEQFILDVCALLGWDAEFAASKRDALKLYAAGYRKFEIADE